MGITVLMFFLFYMIDHIVKFVTVKFIGFAQQITIIPNFLYMEKQFNKGAAFGLGGSGLGTITASGLVDAVSLPEDGLFIGAGLFFGFSSAGASSFFTLGFASLVLAGFLVAAGGGFSSGRLLLLWSTRALG